jgi:hypothetical protein
MDKVFYNEGSAAKLGWTPDWFGCDDFDEDLIDAIVKFQKQHNLTADGLMGPTTYRRVYNDRVANLEDYQPKSMKNNRESFIVYNSDYLPIEWPRVRLFFEGDGYKLTKGFKKMTQKRDPKFFVCHWDVCLSSETCFRVLKKRGISVHFAIDNDGTIYQFMDMNDVAYHAGSRKWNTASVGVEIANAFYPKYQDWYKRKGFGERPVIKDAMVHGKKLETHLGFYPVQLQALQALMKAVHKATGMPLKAPLDRKGNTSTKVSKPVADGRFEGFVSHYHLTNRKIDCAGLDIKKLLEEIK